MTIATVIVLAGLGICCAGVALSWFKKGGTGIWSTFIFGFLLVITGGPLKDSISGLSMTGKGLDLKFEKVSVSEAQQKALEKGIEESLSAAIPANTSETEQQLLDASSQVVIKQLLPFIRSLGFVPTQIISSSRLMPGSVVSIVNGQPTIIASADEAFPKLTTFESSVAFL